MKTRGLHGRWRRNLGRLFERVAFLWEEVRGSVGAGAVHDLRVAIRRARLYARVGRPLLDRQAAEDFNAWGRAVNQALGSLRDCDVAMSWVAGQPQPLGWLECLREERNRLWRAASRELEALSHHAPPFPELRAGLDAGRLRKRFHRALVRVRDEVRRLASRRHPLTPNQRHALRRLVRRWRYLREMGLPPRAQPEDVRLQQLNRVQDVLGELQDLRVTSALLKRIRLPGQPSDLQARLRRETTRLRQNAHRRVKPLLRSNA